MFLKLSLSMLNLRTAFRASVLTGAVLLVFAGPTGAAPIPVTNASFESPSLGIGAYSSSADGWNQLEYNGNGILTIEKTHADAKASSAHDGNQYLQINNRNTTSPQTTQVTQAIFDGINASLVEGTLYTLTVALTKNITSLDETAIRFGLYEDSAMTSIYTQYVGDALLEDFVWNDFTVQFTASAAQAGKPLYIGIENASSNNHHQQRLDVDNVRLSGEAVPEPTSAVLSFIGILALLFVRKWF